jgi:hypothetical protein
MNIKLSPNNLRKASSGLYIDILQQKTKKAVNVGVADPLVIEILENEFPKRVSQVLFNKQIKSICKMAGIVKHLAIKKGFLYNSADYFFSLKILFGWIWILIEVIFSFLF